MTVVSLDHVQVAAPPGCEQAARRFYGDLLGLVEIEKPPALQGRGGVWFACGHQQLHVGVSGDFVPAAKAHPAFVVGAPGIDALAERVRASGLPVRWAEEIPGVRRFFTEDPWGNRIELMAEPGSS